MAEGLLRAVAGDRFEVHSAGTVATGVNPVAIRVMAEICTDVSRRASKALDRYLATRFDWVITVCDDAAGTCPILPRICPAPLTGRSPTPGVRRGRATTDSLRSARFEIASAG